MYKLLINILIMLFSAAFVPAYAADNGLDQVFKDNCIKSWMSKTEGVSDKVEYKNLGEKFCGCVVTKPLKTDAETSQAVQICMSQVLLHDTMDTIEDANGLANLTKETLNSTCLDKWALMNPKMDADTKNQVATYCNCASSQLLELNKNKDNVTDNDWAMKINQIAETCANNVAASQSTKSDLKQQ